MQTPYFLIKYDELQKNVDEFRIALTELWPNSQLAYSVKTNSLPWVLRFMRDNGVLAEVVSDEEFELALMNGYTPDSIIFNGPIKSEKYFFASIERGTYVNIDSQHELELVKKIREKATIGIRVNLNPELFEKKDIEYIEDGFRFGYSDDTGEFKKALKIVQSANAQLGLHLHCNTITRSPSAYKAIAEYAASLILKYSLHLSFIDFGGGFFGGVPGKPSAKEYIEVIKNGLGSAIDINQTKLLIEPGSALICSAIDFHTSVIDVKDTKLARIVTTNGSRVNIDPLWIKSKYTFEIESKGNIFQGKQTICGYTCMDHDRIMQIENSPQLSIDDKVIYKRVGAYSVTFGGPFIRYFPEVYVQDKDKIYKVRHRITTDEYCSLEGG